MNYNFKRAVGIAFCLYMATFVVGLVCGIISGVDMSSFDNFPDSYWYIGMVAALILTYLFASWYFKNPAIIPSAKSGFWFGLTAVILSFLLDYILFTIGNLSAEQKVDLGDYYSDYRFWIIIIIVVATAKLVGHLKRSKATAA